MTKRVTTINFLRGITHLSDSQHRLTKAITRLVEQDGLRPSDPIDPKYLTDYQRAVEEATNKIFSNKPTDEAVKDIVKYVIDKILSKTT